MLAALSLFAAYWPASAVITGIVVAGRATGADRVALGVIRRGAAAVARRLHHSTPPPPDLAPGPEPPPPHPPALGTRDVGGLQSAPGRVAVGTHGRRTPARVPQHREPAQAKKVAPRDAGLS